MTRIQNTMAMVIFGVTLMVGGAFIIPIPEHNVFTSFQILEGLLSLSMLSAGIVTSITGFAIELGLVMQK